jgi:hypothetical protein|tara:strand:+ start:564 stop:737 length:174 start_codon:yes stop_codon:yes gene_type:complete
MAKDKAKKPSKPKKREATALKIWSCEINGNPIQFNEGDKVKLSPFEYEVLSGAGIVK